MCLRKCYWQLTLCSTLVREWCSAVGTMVAHEVLGALTPQLLNHFADPHTCVLCEQNKLHVFIATEVLSIYLQLLYSTEFYTQIYSK